RARVGARAHRPELRGPQLATRSGRRRLPLAGDRMTFVSDRSLLAEHRAWIGYVQPVGLVVSPAALMYRGCVPNKDITAEQRILTDLLTEDEDGRRAVADPPRLFRDLLNWQPADLAGGPGGPPLSD